jgi:hypothetical protein
VVVVILSSLESFATGVSRVRSPRSSSLPCGSPRPDRCPKVLINAGTRSGHWLFAEIAIERSWSGMARVRIKTESRRQCRCVMEAVVASGAQACSGAAVNTGAGDFRARSCSRIVDAVEEPAATARRTCQGNSLYL